MLYWSSGVNSSLAVLMDHDKSNSAAIAAAVTQEINASRDLSVLKEKVEEIRGSVKQATGRK